MSFFENLLRAVVGMFSSSDDDDYVNRGDGTYQDYVCPYCRHESRVNGNGGLVLGMWPTCPKCGTMADEAE